MVRKIFRKRHTAVGARPGTLVIDEQARPTAIHVFEYSAGDVREHEVTAASEIRNLLRQDSKLWVDVRGLGEEAVLREIGDIFQMHPLALEDVVNVPQRPKIESYDNHLLIVTRMVMSKVEGKIEAEQVSILIGDAYVLTIQERQGDVFDAVRTRLKQGKGPIRKLGPDYLAYAILDAVIDGYYPVLESLGEHLQGLEDRTVATPEPSVLTEIHHVKRELLAMRRAIWPQREALNTLVRDDSAFISEEIRIYLRNCYEHCVQIMDAVESYRELAGGLTDLYLSSVGNRQNEVMKVLTIMASVFIPLTFLAGIYGMNFENMPELHIRWAYPILLAVMGVTAVGMFFYFRRKGWVGSKGDDTART